jgi:hypothetical protein
MSSPCCLFVSLIVSWSHIITSVYSCVTCWWVFAIVLLMSIVLASVCVCVFLFLVLLVHTITCCLVVSLSISYIGCCFSFLFFLFLDVLCFSLSLFTLPLELEDCRWERGCCPSICWIGSLFGVLWELSMSPWWLFLLFTLRILLILRVILDFSNDVTVSLMITVCAVSLSLLLLEYSRRILLDL